MMLYNNPCTFGPGIILKQNFLTKNNSKGLKYCNDKSFKIKLKECALKCH
jgi:hypothetical protein